MVSNVYLSMDETLYPTGVGVALLQYNKSKPLKYGLLFRRNTGKVWAPIYHFFMLENQQENQVNIIVKYLVIVILWST